MNDPQIDFENQQGEAWAKCGCSGFMEEVDFENLLFMVTNPCKKHKEQHYSTKNQTWRIQAL